MYEPGRKRSYGDERTENQQMHFNIHGRRSLKKSDSLLETNSVSINKKMSLHLVLSLFRGFVVYGPTHFNTSGFGNDHY